MEKNVEQLSMEAAEAWVRSGIIVPRKTVNKKISSYGLKHIAEQIQGTYISNDALIKAMQDAGYKATRLQNSPNCFFNFSWTQRKKWFLERGVAI